METTFANMKTWLEASGVTVEKAGRLEIRTARRELLHSEHLAVIYRCKDGRRCIYALGESRDYSRTKYVLREHDQTDTRVTDLDKEWYRACYMTESAIRDFRGDKERYHPFGASFRLKDAPNGEIDKYERTAYNRLTLVFKEEARYV